MTFNFDEIYERRNTSSLKWDKFKDRYRAKYAVEDIDNVLPMWVADMDFAVPQVAIDAIKKRLDHPIFGYSYISDACKEAIQQWFKHRHNWHINKEALIFHSGVVPAIATILETFTEPGDKVCISTPVYPPFFNIPKGLKLEVVECDLTESEDQIYEYDFDKLEEAFKSGVKAYVLCSPHNPGGVVWSKETLEKLVYLCIKYDVLLISDEIHADIVFDGHQHIPTMTVEGADQAKIVACIAPTKTFNLAGLHAAMIVAENPKLRNAILRNKAAHGLDDWNALAAAGVQAVYEKGEEWLDEMIQYVSRNIQYLEQELNQLDGVRVIRPQASYLVWIDYRGTGLSEEEMMDRLLNKGKLALEPGTKYSEAGRGYLRINLACPFETVKEGVERFKKALS